MGWDQVERLRKRRNEFEYQGIFEMGRAELKDAVEHAKRFVERIREQLGEVNPQKKFQW